MSWRSPNNWPVQCSYCGSVYEPKTEFSCPTCGAPMETPSLKALMEVADDPEPEPEYQDHHDSGHTDHMDVGYHQDAGSGQPQKFLKWRRDD